jgi:hypothetical protein
VGRPLEPDAGNADAGSEESGHAISAWFFVFMKRIYLFAIVGQVHRLPWVDDSGTGSARPTKMIPRSQ